MTDNTMIVDVVFTMRVATGEIIAVKCVRETCLWTVSVAGRKGINDIVLGEDEMQKLARFIDFEIQDIHQEVKE